MKTKNRPILIVLLLVLSLVGAQCAPKPVPEATAAMTEAPATEAPSAEAGRASIFVYAHPADFPDLDPAKSYSNDSVVMSNCYESLTFYNPPGSKEVLSPKLAVSWESNEDATEWTFHLREGVKFHDGEPFNAEAVKYSISKTTELGIGSAYIWDPVEEMEVVDDYTIKFKLSYSAPLDLIASTGYAAWIYSPKSYEEKGSDWFAEGHCAGTGPYTIESYERGSRLVMTRFEEYWGGWQPGQFEKVVFEISQDPVVNQQKIEAGAADFTYTLPPDNLEALKANQDLVVYENSSFQNLVGLLNTKKPPLDNVKVRQALSYSFPYEQFITGVMGERATQARGVVPAGMWGRSDELFQYTYDLEKARQLLTEAGYPPDGGFKLLMTYASGDLDEQQLGELWKAELAKLGIELKVQGMNWEAQWDLSKSDPLKAQDIFVMYWWPDYVSPLCFLYGMFHSEATLFNLGYYSNPDYDKLVDDGNVETGVDREKAAEMFIQAQQILLDDAVSLFFYDVKNIHFARADVKGFVDNPAYPHVVFVYQLSR